MAGRGLKGSKSLENLKEAFAGESQANRRYLYFARIADIEGGNLGANGIGSKGALAIAKSTTFETLQSLELSGNDVGTAAEGKLKARFGDRLKL